MALYRRRLPHIDEIGKAVFITWKLQGSLPSNRSFPEASLSSGQAFLAMDLLLEQTRSGPLYLSQPAIASMIVDAILYIAEVLGHYELHAFAVMPNHVHLLITPSVPLWKLTKSLKSTTAPRANEMLGLTGTTFWQEESYDHTVRDGREFGSISRYIEHNPVRAGLATAADDFRWSSATRGSRADLGVRPTLPVLS
jgi:putative DNA methylase